MSRPRFTAKRRRAALAAVSAMLAEENESNWPPSVEREDLEGALECIKAMGNKTAEPADSGADDAE